MRPFLRPGEYTLARLASRLKILGQIEDEFFDMRYGELPIEKPVFITGLARAGTDLMLGLLSQAPGVATHRHRDFPFLYAPVMWNRLQDVLAPRGAGQRPEAFEEPLWQAYFAHAHDPRSCHVLDRKTKNPEFEAAFARHLRKILWLRGGRRYVSKGNYNVTRIDYLARTFPDARFVIPVRDPVAQVHSLVGQHRLFCRHAAEDPRVPQYLEASGHYEFGPQRQPVHVDLDRIGEIEAAWKAGDEYRGYARQWAQVYGYVERLRRDPWLSSRILIVRYEDACLAPQVLRRDLLKFCSLADPAGRVNAAAAALTAQQRADIPSQAEEAIWEEAGAIAAKYGYRAPSLAMRQPEAA